VRRIFESSGCFWIAGGALFGASLLVVLLAVLRLGRVGAAVSPPGPTVQVLPFATSTLVQPSAPTPSAGPPSSEAPTGPESTPLAFGVGDYVEVYGTEGDGLRLRSGPSLDASINAMGMENEVFEVRDGPIHADGYTWWYLVNPYDNSKQGWGVATYLRRLQSG
jgi:hypothetical protein